MSTWQREAAEKLRRKYAQTYGVALEEISVTMLEDEDAEVKAPGLPTWTLGRSAPRWATDHKVRTF